MEKSTTIVVP